MLEFGKLKAVIWDMDGVIVDSESSHFKSWQIVFNERGIRVNEDKLRETFGMTTPQVIREVAGGGLNEQTVIEIGAEKERIFRRMIGSEIEYLPGAEHWLKTFYEHGIRQALASSGSQKTSTLSWMRWTRVPFLMRLSAGWKSPASRLRMYFCLRLKNWMCRLQTAWCLKMRLPVFARPEPPV